MQTLVIQEQVVQQAQVIVLQMSVVETVIQVYNNLVLLLRVTLKVVKLSFLLEVLLVVNIATNG